MLSRFGIRQKIFALFTVIALLPLVIINFIWLQSSQDQLEQAADSRQSVLLRSMAQRVDESLEVKINAIITNSQDPNVTELNLNPASLKLLQFAEQDSDVLRIALVDKNGDEQVVINDGVVSENKQNIKNMESFKVVTQLSNNATVGEVTYIEGRPQITIAVPLLNINKLGDQNLTPAQSLARRYGSDINGALIVNVSLSKLWTSVFNAKLGTEGYIYLVNAKGDLIAHPDPEFLARHANLSEVPEVANAMKVLSAFDLESVAARYQPDPQVSRSETGVDVLSSSFPISRTKWAIVGEEPVSSVYSAVRRASVVAFVIFLISVPASLVLVYLATHSIITPIRQLTEGAVRMGAGDFGHKLAATGKDELAVMAQTFNKMGENLQGLLGRLRAQNLNLIAEQTKLQAVLDTIADGVIVLDRNYNVVLINKTIASLTSQKDFSQVGGKPWLDIYQLEYEDKPFNNQLLNDELLFFPDVSLQTGDEEKFIDVTAIRLHDDPNGIAYILTIHDITQRRELENMKLDFVSMAAHELRTPLTALRGYLDLLATVHSGTSKYDQFIRQAKANATMLGNLIDNLLSLSRIERKSLTLNSEKLDWKRVVSDVVHDHSFAADAKKIIMDSQLPEVPAEIWGDEFALREVLGNLVSNAIHYTDEGGKVTVKVEVTSEAIRTAVIDTGIGIPESSVAKLFTKYYRADGGLTTNSQGTGIGLFISKSIVDAHDGKIGVNSEPGRGSEFFFTLPPYNAEEHRQSDDDSATMGKTSKVDWF